MPQCNCNSPLNRQPKYAAVDQFGDIQSTPFVVNSPKPYTGVATGPDGKINPNIIGKLEQLRYSNPGTLTTVGNIPAGTVINAVPILDLLDTLFGKVTSIYQPNVSLNVTPALGDGTLQSFNLTATVIKGSSDLGVAKFYCDTTLIASLPLTSFPDNQYIATFDYDYQVLADTEFSVVVTDANYEVTAKKTVGLITP